MSGFGLAPLVSRHPSQPLKRTPRKYKKKTFARKHEISLGRGAEWGTETKGVVALRGPFALTLSFSLAYPVPLARPRMAYACAYARGP